MLRAFTAATVDVGPPMTIDPRWGGTSVAAFGAANRCHFARVAQGGVITGITIEVGTASGNISVAVYRSTGTGVAARPGTRIATTGAIACPATGAQTVPLGATVIVQPGDWFALSCDNITATFRRVLNNATFTLSLFGQMDTAHPAPVTPTINSGASTVMMVGT